MNNDNQDNSVLQTTMRLIDNLLVDSTTTPSLLPILSVLCLITILERAQGTSATARPVCSTIEPAPTSISQTTRNTTEPQLPDMLLSFLPLLNSPQLKSKITPSNISNLLSILSIANSSSSTKSEQPLTQAEKPSTQASEKKETPPSTETVTKVAPSESSIELPSTPSTDKKPSNGNLNWKSNF